MRVPVLCRCVAALGGLALASCATEAVLHPYLDRYPGSITHSKATAQFLVPPGWEFTERESRRHGSYSGGQCSLAPAGQSRQQWYPSMDLYFGRINPTVSASESSQVKSYLAAVRIKTDSTAQMEPAGVIQNPQHGAIRIYHLRAIYHGQHLYAEIVDGPLCFICDLTGCDASELFQQRPALEAIIRSVSIFRARE